MQRLPRAGREVFSRQWGCTVSAADTLREVRQFCREPFAFPGGYPRLLVMSDGECLCHICARGNYRLISAATRHPRSDRGWEVAAVDIHWEGAPESCTHCGAQIDSAYGEPDQD